MIITTDIKIDACPLEDKQGRTNYSHLGCGSYTAEYDTKWIKDYCVMCQNFMPESAIETKERYEMNGNYCKRCTAKVNGKLIRDAAGRSRKDRELRSDA